MATGADVLHYLRPNGGWVITGDDFDSIRYTEGVEPLTKSEFENGFAKYDQWKTQENEAQKTKRAEVLAKLAILGLSEDDLKALGL